MSFRIDCYTPADVKYGPPITEVIGVSISERLNQIGQATITIPASIAAMMNVQRGTWYYIYHDELGYLGKFKHQESSIDASAKTMTITAYDSLISLSEQVAGFRRNFNNATFSAAATSLFTTSLGWTVSYEEGEPSTNITFSVEGENYLRVADYLRTYIRGWFRREGDTHIRFGTFATTTPSLTFTAPDIVIDGPAMNQALITQIARTRNGGSVVNRVYPVGAGIGETKLDLRYSTRTSPYTVQSSSVGGGTTAWYLEDSTSVNSYGRVERVVAWNEIRPITNSAADLQNASNALYDIASAYLQKYKLESDAYTLQAVEVPSTLRVGDVVRVYWNGVANLETGNVGWLNVANNFYVTEIQRQFDSGGNAQTTLSISANGDEVVGNTEVLYDILADVQTLKLRTQPMQTYYSKSSDTIVMQTGASPSTEFYFRLGPELLAINEMYLEITVRQMTYPSAVIASGNAFTSFASINGVTMNTSTVTPTLSTEFVTVQSDGSHRHSITVGGATVGGANDIVYAITGNNDLRRGGATVTLNNGTDTVGTHTHGTVGHTHTGTNHAHGMNHTHTLTSLGGHTHAITIGGTTGAVASVSTKPRIAIGSLDIFPGSPYIVMTAGTTGNTVINSLNSGTGAIVNATIGGASVTAVEGFVNVRINLISPTDYTALFDWRNAGSKFILVNANDVACTVHAQLYGRVTIQPIAV